MTALLSAAFAAGMVSTVNPCGFAMLPAYLGVFVGDASGRRPIGLVAGAVSSGFLIVFTAAGLLVGVGGRGRAGLATLHAGLEPDVGRGECARHGRKDDQGGMAGSIREVRKERKGRVR